MIAKRAKRRKDGKSSFSKLSDYITREGKGEEVAYSKATNCGFDSVELAVKEIEATQARNTRSTIDKTYHLVVSFPAGEVPTKEQLEDIESEVCKSIGLGDHQRVSAAHTDTDNFHLHIAINKIHPVSHRAVEPYYDKYRLDEACSRLELKHGLKHDNRIDRTNAKEKGQEREPGRAGDMEAHSGIDSFKRWVKERKEPLQAVLNNAKTWDELHQGLAKHGLELRPHGAGLVISSRDQKAFTKASDIGREFSKPNLEKKLGVFQQPDEHVKTINPDERYIKPPSQKGAERSGLWDQYQREKNEAVAIKRDAFKSIKERREAEVAAHRKDYAARKKAIQKDLILKKRQKKDVYRKLSENHRARTSAAFKRHQVDKKAIQDKHPVKTWQEWLVDKATAGDEAALKALRSNTRKPGRGAEKSGFSGTNQHTVFTPLEPDVKANGDVLYTVKGARIRDTGGELRLDADKGGDLASAVRLARDKYGDHLSVNGDDKFKAAVVEAAVSSGQNVTFADPEMERRRQLLSELSANKSRDNRPRQPDQGENQAQEGKINEWIHKRNETSKKASDILQHKRFTENDAGAAIYKGSRKVSEGVIVGLYEKSGVMLVAPITERQAARFGRKSVGETVKLNKRGHVQFQQTKKRGNEL